MGSSWFVSYSSIWQISQVLKFPLFLVREGPKHSRRVRGACYPGKFFKFAAVHCRFRQIFLTLLAERVHVIMVSLNQHIGL